MRLPSLVLLASCLVFLAPASADEPIMSTGSVDFGAWRTSQAATGPILWIPEDTGEVPGTETRILGPMEPPWIQFDSPAFDPFPFAADNLLELVQSSFPFFQQVEGTWIQVEGQSLRFGVPAKDLEAVRRGAVEWLGAIAPAMEIQATLRAQDGQGEVLAAGSTRLWPGRWSRVYLTRNVVPSVVGFQIEVAQEATVMDPVVLEMPEGRELYACFHPGESVSLVELWGGTLQIVDTTTVDISEIRNVPEASAPGTLTLPQTSVKRSFTAMAVSATEPTARQLRWMGPGGPIRLDLRFVPGAGRPSTPAASRHQAVRVGALGAGLAFETRPSNADGIVERAKARSDAGTSMVSQEIAVFDADPTLIDAARKRIAADETALVSPEVSLRLLPVPEAATRAPLTDGSLRIGAAVPAAMLRAFHEAGATEGWSVRLPVLVGVPASFRSGSSVTGIADVNVEIAQSAAGSAPVCAARFAGFAGQVALDPAPGGYRLRVTASYTWADPEAGRLQLVFRPPVTMSMAKNQYQEEPDFRRRVTLPVLGGGRADLTSGADVPSGSTDEVLLSTCVHGGEVVLLLASVR